MAPEVSGSFRCLSRLSPLWEAGGVLYYPHQFEAAQRVLEEFGGSAILADEVGLGKTFEAGLVMAELMERGDARRALVLVPASLVTQWQEEMWRFFRLEFTAEPADPASYPLVIASLDWAKRSPQAMAYLRQEWDVVVVDEAHRLKNQKSLNHTFVKGLLRAHLLLLTATPIENDLNELYSLVSLVRIGAFGSYMDFYRQFIFDRHTPKNQALLKQILSEVMIRRTRLEAGLNLPEREVQLFPLDLSVEERELYDAVTDALRTAYGARRQEGGNLLPLILVQREICSSSFALLGTLERMQPEWLGDRLEEIQALARALQENTKARVVAGLLRRLGESAIVFTEYRETQNYLIERLRADGFLVHAFHGSLAAREKRRVQERFREMGGVLVSTEAGGLGVNLQFARVVVNYDLPWNPMRVEQRIGRVHRLGQTKTVLVVNLYARKTVEEHLLTLLHLKIDLFRKVIGDLDVVLRNLERERPIEMRLFDIFLSASDDATLEVQIDRLGTELLRRGSGFTRESVEGPVV